jgi:hypothetical protein
LARKDVDFLGRRAGREYRRERRGPQAPVGRHKIGKGVGTRKMMGMSTMSTGMMVAMGLVWLVILAFLVLGIAAFIKYLRS